MIYNFKYADTVFVYKFFYLNSYIHWLERAYSRFKNYFKDNLYTLPIWINLMYKTFM